MLKNKEVKRLLFYQLGIIFFFIVLTIIVNMDNYYQYQRVIIDNNVYIANALIKKYPELENEIVDIIINSQNNQDNVLEKYGLDKMEVYERFNDSNILKQRIINNNLILVGSMLIVMLSLTIVFLIKQYRKIRNIDAYLYRILNDNYTLDIREYEEGDLSNLKNDIYKVTVKLKNMSEQSLTAKKYLEDILSDISHQIKTPLTSMYVINDLLMSDEMKPKVRKDFLNKNRLQLERIEWLVTSLLKISRLDSGSIILNRKEVNILELVNNALEPLRIPMELKNMEVTLNIESHLTFIGDFKWTNEALINIIKNAYEHTLEGGKIIIEASDNPLYTLISITDNGEGIDKKDLPLIFKRFYKGNSNKESIGIGLNMAQMIIERQNGVIEVDSIKEKYTTFTIKLYKKNI